MNNIERLTKLFANTYALYLKTQSYHWHVEGPFFISYHQLFEEQYQELAEAVDELAERIRMLGALVPASFSKLAELKTLDDIDDKLTASEMIEDLSGAHHQLLNELKAALSAFDSAGDEATVGLIGERISRHEKMRWMLSASL